MSNPSGKKGTAWETAVVNLLERCGHRARRKRQTGAKDKGDIELLDVPMVLVEAKNWKGASLAEWVDEAVEEAENAGVPVCVVWHHRRLTASPAGGYVTMVGHHFIAILDLLKEVAFLRRRIEEAGHEAIALRARINDLEQSNEIVRGLHEKTFPAYFGRPDMSERGGN